MAIRPRDVSVTGFQFRYRINGGVATIRSLPRGTGAGLARGDMLIVANGGVEAGAADATGLLGAVIDAGGGEPSMLVKVVTDADAIYAVQDPFARRAGELLELAGASGGQGVKEGPHAQLVVVANSAATEETLVRIEPQRHHVPVSSEPPLTPGQLNAAIARAIVQAHREYVGRGPTKARAFFREEVIVVLMEQVMTTAERSLADDGRGVAVLRARRELRAALRPRLVAAVERVTQRHVSAVLSDHCIEPDLMVDVFVLDQPVSTVPEPGG
jgi:uncharacterized protein YbcI